YRIWVSEVMLQQTTVAAVAARYDAFLARFPDLPALARARESSVLAAWSGLGYYARARNLHAAARRIVSAHGGRLPRDPATLATLPGFGDYLSAAVASLAFGARVPALDTNVTRVVSRLFAVQGEAGTRAHTELLRRRVTTLLPARDPGDLTAALMDLGQQICTARRPACTVCPVARFCAARAMGSPERFPRRRAKPRTRRVFQAAAVAARAGRTLVMRSDGELLRRMWLFPSAEGATAGSARARLARRLAKLGLRLVSDAPVAAARHTIVHRRLEIAVYPAVPASHAASNGVRWLTAKALAAAPIPTLTRRIAVAAGFLPPR
ncbi:MAG: NUDIX domain-containing protein, partial [Thermoanaerobaculia bacterium]